MVIERILPRKLRFVYTCFTPNIKSLHHGALLTSRITQAQLSSLVQELILQSDTAHRNQQKIYIYIYVSSFPALTSGTTIWSQLGDVSAADATDPNSNVKMLVQWMQHSANAKLIRQLLQL